MRVRHLLVSLALLGLLALPAPAQKMESVPQAQQQPAATATMLKVGVLDLQEAMGRTKEGQKASEDLQAQFGPRNAELQKLADDIQELESQLRAQERTLSENARVTLTRQVEQKRRAAQRLQEDLQADFQAARDERLGKIWTNIQKVIDQYARERGFSIIINRSLNPDPIIYAAPAVEITDDIVRLYDQLYPLAPSTPAGQSKPARPAQPPPQPQQKPPQPPR